MSRGQLKRVNHRTECSVTSCRNMITFASEEETECLSFYSGAKKKKRKDSLTLPLLMYPLPSSTQHLSLGDKPTSNRSVQPVSSEHTHMRSYKSPSMVRFHFENNGNFTTTWALPLICRGGGGQRRRKEHKGQGVSSGKSFHWKKMRHELEYLPLLP